MYLRKYKEDTKKQTGTQILPSISRVRFCNVATLGGNKLPPSGTEGTENLCKCFRGKLDEH